jgi:hypothetical protein
VLNPSPDVPAVPAVISAYNSKVRMAKALDVVAALTFPAGGWPRSAPNHAPEQAAGRCDAVHYHASAPDRLVMSADRTDAYLVGRIERLTA